MLRILKSRIVFESVTGGGDLVVYVADENAALTLVAAMVNDARCKALVVVDDCSVAVRAKLIKLMRGTGDRLRAVIVLDSVEDGSYAGPRLLTLGDEDVGKILERNFELTPGVHRRAIAELSDGVLQVAHRLCRTSLRQTTFLEETVRLSEESLVHLVADDNDVRLLSCLSLVARVGYAGAVQDEFMELCGLFELSPPEALRRARHLAKTSGLIHVGHKYLALRPRVFARAFLRRAWEDRSTSGSVPFLDAASQPLRRRMLEQLAQHATPAIRDEVATWARPWMSALEPRDVRRAGISRLLLPLVELHPTRHLPVLRALVERLPPDERVGPWEVDRWSVKMLLIWLLEKLGAYAEFFDDSEATLFALAQAESEPAIGQTGSATATWAGMFRPVLSGTEVPFTRRIDRLSERLAHAAGERDHQLVVAGLSRVLGGNAWRMEGATIVAGGPKPPEWTPQTRSEWVECIRAGIELAGQALRKGPSHAGTLKIFEREGRRLLRTGYLDDIKLVFEGVSLTDEARMTVLAFVTAFLDYDCDGKRDAKPPPEYVQRVRDWASAFELHDLAGRLTSFLSTTTMKQYVDDKAAWQERIRCFAVELWADQAELRRQIPALAARESGKSMALLPLGECAGELDVEAKVLPLLVEATGEGSNPLFARGYLLGLLRAHSQHYGAVAEAINAREADAPHMAVDLSCTALTPTDAVARATRLVDGQRIRPIVMRDLWRTRFGASELVTLMECLLGVRGEHRCEAVATAIDLIGPRVTDPTDPLASDAGVVSAAWQVVEAGIQDVGAEGHWWGRMLEKLCDIEPDRACDIACRGLLSDDLSVEDEASRCVQILIGRDPAKVMTHFGPRLLDPENGWRFAGGDRGGVVASFPINILESWLKGVGVAAARLLAPHLPLPHLDGSGSPHVPPLTAFVLKEFEDDEKVFQAFVTGSHNLQLYSGDIVGAHESEAAIGAAFFNHPLRRIREWAQREHDRGRAQAQWWREHEEEEFE